MTYSAAVTTHLALYEKAVHWVLHIKTGFTGGTTWREMAFKPDWELTLDEDTPATLRAGLCNDDLAFSDEARVDPRSLGIDPVTIIGAQVRMLCYVGVYGTYALIAVDTGTQTFTIDGDHVAEFDAPTIFEITGSTGNDGRYQVASASLVGGDTEIIVINTIPDATVDGNIVVAEHECKFDGYIKGINPSDYSFEIQCADWSDLANNCEGEVDLEPTAVNVTPEDETGTITNREIQQISAALGQSYGFVLDGSGTDPAFDEATQSLRRSWRRTNIQLWRDNPGSPASARVAGQDPAWEDVAGEVPPKHYAIDYESGAIKILERTQYHTVSDDSWTDRKYYLSFVDAYLESSATGAANVDLARIVEQAFATAATEDGGGPGMSFTTPLTDTGLDLGKQFYFRGKIADLLSQIRRDSQVNVKLRWDHINHRLRLDVVTQKAAASEDWTAIHPISIAQARDDKDLFTRIVVRGQSSLPINQANTSNTTAHGDVSAGDFFGWNGDDAAASTTFDAEVGKLFDGDANLGCSVMGSTPLLRDTWYGFVTVDLGSVKRVDRIRLHMPGSRNPNAANGDQRGGDSGDDPWGFWPGVKVYGSETNPTWVAGSADWHLMSPLLYGHFKPHDIVDASEAAILHPKARYVCVVMNPYKHGYKSGPSVDLSIGLAELEIFTDAEYRIVRAIDGAATPTTTYTYTDGTTWERNYPDLWTRFSERYRTRFEDLGNEYDEFVAQDIALKMLAESIRLFQTVSYSSVCDPRIQLYDTVVVNDDLNGNVGSILVTQVRFGADATQFSGTNYLAGAL